MPFKKGQSGNPDGRPRWGESLTEMLRKEMGQMHEVKDVDGRVRKVMAKEIVVRRLINNAMSGRDSALRQVFEYYDGKPDQPVTLKSGGIPGPDGDLKLTAAERKHIAKQLKDVLFPVSNRKRKGKS